MLSYLINVKNMNKKIDYLIVGCGLFGATCARLLADAGKTVLIIEKRNHVAGNIYTKKVNGIDVHVYGAHIFHTSNKDVWDFVNKYCEMKPFINSPLANYHGEIYHLPFNMNTFHELWDVNTPEEAKSIIDAEIKKEGIVNPTNLEEQALSMVGRSIYTKLIKEYTEKQWGRSCSELPSFIIKRLPLRFEYNNNYFNDTYQGIPSDGYTNLVKNIVKGIKIILKTDFLDDKKRFEQIANHIIYTGPIDEYFDYCYGQLEYRSLKFVNTFKNIVSFQNNAVVNYTSHDVAYTRIIEHKYFLDKEFPYTIISEEYPDKWEIGKERFYTVNNDRNNKLYLKYSQLASQVPNITFGGRLGLYKYLDMDDTIEEAMKLVQKLLS